ncbi:MAG: hypothetical protein PHP88_11265, partial [bacterium]|nr:hypothetical protein [bacterium]
PVIAWLPAGFVYVGILNATGKLVSSTRLALLASSAQLIIEIGRAFTEYRHPDITNILLAAAGATIGAQLWGSVWRGHHKPNDPEKSSSDSPPR